MQILCARVAEQLQDGIAHLGWPVVLRDIEAIQEITFGEGISAGHGRGDRDGSSPFKDRTRHLELLAQQEFGELVLYSRIASLVEKAQHDCHI